MEFSPMRKNPTVFLALALAAGLIFSSVSMPLAREAYAATTNLSIDISGTLNTNDFPYGIAWDGANTVWVTLFNQGNLVKIDVAGKTVTEIYNDPDGSIASGQGFYSVDLDDNGNVWVNERDSGKVWKFEPGTETWTSIPIVEEITGNADVTYPDGFTTSPNLIRIDENPGTHGFHTYEVSMNSFGGVILANGFIYVGLSYDVNFDDQAEANAGVSDLAFSGLAKIDPDTDTVTRIAIAGSDAPTGMDIDSSDSSILWITDQPADKVYKYDTDTDTILETVTLTSGSNPRGIANDASYVYVALNKDAGGNSEILKITKASTSTQTTIDTGAENTDGGTFTVFVSDNLLLWTDQSAHIGTIDLDTSGKTSETVSFADSNHFGVKIGSEFWWAGKGSAVVGFTDITTPPAPAAESTGNDDPPSKKGRSLGLVISCAFSGRSCDELSTIGEKEIEWLLHSNVAKQNPQVMELVKSLQTA